MQQQQDLSSPTLRQHSAFAVQHLLAAARFSRQCGEIQCANEGEPLGPFFDEQIACVSATVMLAVASLESNINEYLADSAVSLPEITEGARAQLVDLLEAKPILDKYSRVLAARELEPFNRGEAPYQDVDLLVKIRNELVHFHPEWHDDQERHSKLGERLRSRFEFSPFIPDGAGVLFPQRMVGHGCTKWAVESALRFMVEFTAKARLPNKFDVNESKYKG